MLVQLASGKGIRLVCVCALFTREDWPTFCDTAGRRKSKAHLIYLETGRKVIIIVWSENL